MTGTVSPAIGPILVRWQVEQAVVATLNTWLGQYLTEVERQLGKAQGAIERPAAICGSLDNMQGEAENTPAVLVVAQPTGENYRSGSGELNEWYLIKVISICIQGNETDARLLADVYGAATQAAVLQGWSQTQPVNGINHLASDLAVRTPPETEFFEADSTRDMTQATVEFDAFVSSAIASAVSGLGTIGTPVDDFNDVPDVPTVATTHVTFVGESADGSTTETNPE